jgi:hypothetical protein
VKKIALVSAFCALLFTRPLAAADANDVPKLAGLCAAGNQKSCEKLQAAIRKLTDQALLAKIALESQYGNARQAAVLKLTDQTLLAKIALGDKETKVRQAAVSKLTDQALLVRIAIEPGDIGLRFVALGKLTGPAALARVALEGDGQIRSTAVNWLTDPAALANVALESKDRGVSQAAVRSLIDQALLAKVALESKDEGVSQAAVQKLTDHALLEKVAAESSYWAVRQNAIGKLDEQAALTKAAKEIQDRSLRLQAIAARDPSDPNLNYLAGNLGAPTSDPMQSAARIKLAIREPRIRNRFPLIVFTPQVALRSHGYFGISKGGTMPGESVAFELRQAGQTLAQKTWSTVFPQQTWEFVFLAAHVDATDLLRELLRKAVFTPDDLAELSSSEIPELRQAAQERLAQIQPNAK